MAAFETVTTSRGNVNVWHQDRQFIYNRDSPNGVKTYWRCSRRFEAMHCMAILHTLVDAAGDWCELTHPHHPLCQPMPFVKEAKKMVQYAKELAGISLETPSNIVTRLDCMLTPEAAQHYPLEGAMQRMLARARVMAYGGGGMGNAPLDQLVLAPRLLQHPRDRHFTCLIHDSGRDDPNRMIVFGTEASANLLLLHDEWFADGTYKVCPQQFKQVYSIHVRFRNRYVPCVIALLTGHGHLLYERFLTVLVNRFPALQNRRLKVMTDFELAAKIAFSNVFPNSEHSFCMFHLLQSVWRHVQSLGLAGVYRQNAELAIACRMLAAVCFVPPANVLAAFNEIQAEPRWVATAAAFPALIQLSQYFVHTYLGIQNPLNLGVVLVPPTFTISTWNMHQRTVDRRPRTNNGVEAFHSGFRKGMGIMHPPMPHFVTHTKWHLIHKVNEIDRLVRRGLLPRPTNARYAALNVRVTAIAENYANYATNYAYVRHVAHNFRLG